MNHQPNLAPSKSLLVTVLEKKENKRERILIQPRTLQRKLEESGGPFVWKEGKRRRRRSWGRAGSN